MKSSILLLIMVAMAIVCNAQFVGSLNNLPGYCVVNRPLGRVSVNGSDIKIEVGHFEVAENSVGKKAKLLKNSSRIVGTGAILGGIASGNGMTALRGIQTAGKAEQVARIAEATESLTAGKAQYLTVSGKRSKSKVEFLASDGIVIMVESNDTVATPNELFAVVHFETVKKNRCFKLSDVQESLVSFAKEQQFVDFDYERVEGGFQLTLKEEEQKEGEYGVIRLPIVPGAGSVAIATFSVKANY